MNQDERRSSAPSSFSFETYLPPLHTNTVLRNETNLVSKKFYGIRCAIILATTLEDGKRSAYQEGVPSENLRYGVLEIDLPEDQFGLRTQGKVRDIWVRDGKRIT